MAREQPSRPADDQPEEPSWRSVRDALRDLRYGSVTVIVQDGIIVQIDRTEKIRLSGKKPHG